MDEGQLNEAVVLMYPAQLQDVSAIIKHFLKTTGEFLSESKFTTEDFHHIIMSDPIAVLSRSVRKPKKRQWMCIRVIQPLKCLRLRMGLREGI